jgi:hypothetical protein
VLPSRFRFSGPPRPSGRGGSLSLQGMRKMKNPPRIFRAGRSGLKVVATQFVSVH